MHSVGGLLVGLPERPGHVGLHEAGRQGVHAHARCELLGQLARQVDQRRLRDVVGADEGRRAQAADGGDVQHHSASLAHAVPPGRLTEAERPGDVRVPDLRDRAELGIDQRPEDRVGRRVVHEDVDRPELGDAVRHRGVCDLGIARGTAVRGGFAAQGLERRARFVELVLLARHDAYGRAGRREGLGDRATDAPGAAGDECGAPVEAEHLCGVDQRASIRLAGYVGDAVPQR